MEQTPQGMTVVQHAEVHLQLNARSKQHLAEGRGNHCLRPFNDILRLHKRCYNYKTLAASHLIAAAGKACTAADVHQTATALLHKLSDLLQISMRGLQTRNRHSMAATTGSDAAEHAVTQMPGLHSSGWSQAQCSWNNKWNTSRHTNHCTH
jgi:hypothetical protein